MDNNSTSSIGQNDHPLGARRVVTVLVLLNCKVTRFLYHQCQDRTFKNSQD